MADARHEVLARLKARARGAVAAPPPPGPPAIAPEALAQAYRARVAALAADLLEAAAEAALPAALAAHLTERGEPLRLRLAAEPWLAGLDWAAAGFTLANDPEDVEAVTVTGVAAAIAETGQILLTSDRAASPLANLTAGRHVAVVRAGDLCNGMEAGWAKAQTPGGPPRAAVFVAGPSRSADIEQTVELGVHGAIALSIALVGC